MNYEYTFSSFSMWEGVETTITTRAANGWRLHTMYHDVQRGRYRLIFERAKQATVGKRAFERKL